MTDGRTRQVSAEIFCILEGEDSPPETAVILIRDDDTGQEVECTGFLTDAEEKGVHGQKNFLFRLQSPAMDRTAFFWEKRRYPEIRNLPNGEGSFCNTWAFRKNTIR